MNVVNAWQSVLGQLQMEMPRASFNTWVKDTNAIQFQEGIFTVGAKNAYARDWLENRLSSTIVRLLSGILDQDVNLEFVVSGVTERDELSFEQPAEESFHEPVRKSASPQQRSINPRYTFDNYVIGSNNRLAHAASMAVADNPATAYNPLFIYGGVGLGKTHLLHAIGNSCIAKGKEVLYVSSEEFMNDLIQSIRTHTTQAFRDKYRSVDVLLLDDIQFIAGKEGTQEEFFHTFNTLHSQGKQIVISSDRCPKAMATLEERLRSRFEWGLLADIQPPDLETRLAILTYKAERLGKAIPGEILDMIAKRVHSNIRELEGALNRIVAFSELSGVPMNMKLAEVALIDLLPQKRDISTGQLLSLVAAEWHTTVDQLTGKSRARQVAEPRQVAMYLLRNETNASLPQIGEVLGGRDHTTIMYGIEKVTNELIGKKDIERRISSIKQKLYNPQAYAAI